MNSVHDKSLKAPPGRHSQRNECTIHEMGSRTNIQRLLLFPLRADEDNSSTLYIATVYLKDGLHSLGNIKSLEASTRPITINWPLIEQEQQTSDRKVIKSAKIFAAS